MPNFWHTPAVSCYKRAADHLRPGLRNHPAAEPGSTPSTTSSCCPEDPDLSNPEVVKKFYFYGAPYENDDPERFLKCTSTLQDYVREYFSGEERYKFWLAPKGRHRPSGMDEYHPATTSNPVGEDEAQAAAPSGVQLSSLILGHPAAHREAVIERASQPPFPRRPCSTVRQGRPDGGEAVLVTSTSPSPTMESNQHSSGPRPQPRLASASSPAWKAAVYPPRNWRLPANREVPLPSHICLLAADDEGLRNLWALEQCSTKTRTTTTSPSRTSTCCASTPAGAAQTAA